MTVPDGGFDQRILTISNNGDADLSYNLSLTEASRNFHDDMESGINGWTHAGTSDLWHQTTHRYRSSNHSWYVGNEDSWEYNNNQHCWLISPEFFIGEGAQFTFEHWIDAEIYDANEAWDGGIVEISTDGDNWSPLTPVGGYPYTIYENPDSPFPAGTPCYAGVDAGWSQAVFDLSAYAEQNAQVRFRFGSDGYTVEEGWYIDDVAIAGQVIDWLEVQPASGVIPPHSETAVTVAFDGSGYSDVTLNGQIRLLSNDPQLPEMLLPVTFIVGGVPVEPISDLTITVNEPLVTISWSEIEGATSYKIYESENPYGDWTLIGSTPGTNWNQLYTGGNKFFQVTWE